MTEAAELADENAVAIVGMAGRFPGAANVEELWHNLLSGISGLRRGTPGSDPAFVPVSGPLDGIELFDAEAFGFTPREAETTEPHHRLLLECSWEALERSGYCPTDLDLQVGVFAGCAFPDYLTQNLGPDLAREPGGKQYIAAGVERDSVTSLISYKLGLRGPSLTVQTYCSTSLVAVHLACQSLLTYECDMALAGGAHVPLPQGDGYHYEEGGILSPDGQVRSLDAAANGTVMGSGAAVVVLRRLSDALEDGDLVHAVIRGSAVNNDGRDRAGYAAPGVSGQAAVIEAALAVADVDPASVGYVECHAVGTPMGDSIELAALQRVLGDRGDSGPCVLSSYKPSTGHLDRASGATALIRAALSLRHQVLPATAGFEHPNPALAAGDFTVLADNQPWPAGPDPRRAGVSSFGVGGTNAHVTLEEAPPRRPRPAAPGPHLLTFSAASPEARDELTRRLREHLAARQEIDLADVAYTLQVSRGRFALRRAVACQDHDDALRALADPGRWIDGETRRRDPQVRLVPAPGTDPAWLASLTAAMAGLGARIADAGSEASALDVPLPPPPAPDAGPEAQARAQLETVARLWQAGCAIDWTRLASGYRVELPSYPFQRRRYWIDAPSADQPPVVLPPTAPPVGGPSSWQPRTPPAADLDLRLRASGPWLLLAADPRGEALAQRLIRAGAEVVTVRPGTAFAADPAGDFTVRPAEQEDLAKVLHSLLAAPRTVVHAFSLGAAADGAGFARAREWGITSATALGRALDSVGDDLPPAPVVLLTSGAALVSGADLDHPEHAALGPLATWLATQRHCPQSRHIDLGVSAETDLALDAAAGPYGGQFAIRDGQAWTLGTAAGDQEPAAAAIAASTRRAATRRPRPALTASYLEPAAGLETTVAETWTDVLAVTEVGADDNFFELGGRSAAAVQIANRLAAQHPSLALTAVLEYPTVRLLSAHLAQSPA